MAAADFHSKGGEVQGDVWELTSRALTALVFVAIRIGQWWNSR